MLVPLRSSLRLFISMAANLNWETRSLTVGSCGRGLVCRKGQCALRQPDG